MHASLNNPFAKVKCIYRVRGEGEERGEASDVTSIDVRVWRQQSSEDVKGRFLH